MLLDGQLYDIGFGFEKTFNIIEEFASLSPRQKVLLCDHLFVEGRQAFYNMVEVLWPDAVNVDAKKLEKFLYALTNRAST